MTRPAKTVLTLMARFLVPLVLISYLGFLTSSCTSQTDLPQSAPSDFTGFWKVRCSEAFGVQIKKQSGNLFSVSFCGPGGCFEPGKWRPNTPIAGDPEYRVIDPTTLDMRYGDGWLRYTKCTTDTNPVLDYSTMLGESSSTTQLGTAPPAALESQPYILQPAPTLPFFDWGACPFEGCTYGKWTAKKVVDVFDTWKPSRKRIATLPTKTVVTGLSGLVITYKPGVIRLNSDLPQDGLQHGDTILTYTYRGEGLSAVWFKGRFYSEYDISFAKWPDGSGCLGTDCAGTYVDLGEKVWWAKVKMRPGRLGWVNMNEAEFGGIDRFAMTLPDSPFSVSVLALPGVPPKR